MARFLKSWFSKGEENGDDGFTSAHLGEENNFYYNEELKQWVVRGEEDKVKKAASASPPPSGRSLLTDSSIPSITSQSSISVGSAHQSAFGPGRRVLRSANLYTEIPGMQIVETKTTNESFLNLPFSSSASQFIPSNDNVDQSIVDDVYADIVSSASVNEASTDVTESTRLNTSIDTLESSPSVQ
ncbi:conserved hypothetical protein [Theileria equi strain WA]|uniref:Uncharacterized protein n=1 Tax=Theileria equi strain WA TaxID=1537102 RepID=L1LDG0_THEEQ|nr:conserved hypothetical protein [Theileria equi strain WA]EKX73299.1 conserved hypothetical protein [Theileria equi strain WA]|eukprot:XP_004832751.1 conserved hypothetical protein [Theileria equi strain WA]